MAVNLARQLLQVAKGLQYLHSLDIPHGDLNGVSPLSDRLLLHHVTLWFPKLTLP